MSTAQLSNEDLELRVDEATVSLDLNSRICIDQEGHNVIFLTSEKYSKLYAAEDRLAYDSIQEIPKGSSRLPGSGLNDFVQRALEDDYCWGFVPLTDEIQQILKVRFELNPVIQGDFVESENRSYEVYH